MMRPDFERLEQLLAKHDNRLEKYRYSPVEKQIIPDAPIGHLLYLPQEIIRKMQRRSWISTQSMAFRMEKQAEHCSVFL